MLDPIHHEGIRLFIDAFRTNPTESILCYVGEMPLQFIRGKNKLLFCIKRKTTLDHISHTALFKNKNPIINRNATQKNSIQYRKTTPGQSRLCTIMNIHISVEEKSSFKKLLHGYGT